MIGRILHTVSNVYFKNLIHLQKNRIITIKACDKGAGVIILNLIDYMRSCYDHLLSKIENDKQEPEYYYKEVSVWFMAQSKGKIIDTLQEGLLNGWISQEEFLAMNPEDCDPANFYCLFKVHKKHIFGQPPPVRPIISGSGSITENMGKFVKHHIKPLSNKHQSYLQDTPHFLCGAAVVPPFSCGTTVACAIWCVVETPLLSI